MGVIDRAADARAARRLLDHARAVARRRRLRLDAVDRAHRHDALLCPVAGVAPDETHSRAHEHDAHPEA